MRPFFDGNEECQSRRTGLSSTNPPGQECASLLNSHWVTHPLEGISVC